MAPCLLPIRFLLQGDSFHGTFSDRKARFLQGKRGESGQVREQALRNITWKRGSLGGEEGTGDGISAPL